MAYLPNDSWNPDLYNTISRPQLRDGMRLIDLLDIKNGETILDVGCGPGTLTLRLADLAPNGKVYGLDASQKMIKYAKKNAQRMKKNNIEFINMDVRDMQYESLFDVIFSSSVLHWVQDQETILKLFKKALKKDGRVGIQIGAKNSFQEGTAIAREIIEGLGLPRYYENWIWPCLYPTKEEYILLLKKAGFHNINVEFEERVIWFNNTEDAIAFYKESGLHSYLSNLSKSHIDLFLEKFREKFYEVRTKQGIKTTVKCLFVIAAN